MAWWLWCALCGFLAVGSFITGSFIAGFLALFAGIIALPVQSIRGEMTKDGVSKSGETIPGLTGKGVFWTSFGFIMAASVVLGYQSSPSKSAEEKASSVAINAPDKEVAVKPKEVTPAELEQRLAINLNGNATSQKLMALSEQQRSSVMARGTQCTPTNRTMYMGSDKDGTDSWSLGCREGDVVVSISVNDQNNRVTECQVLKAVANIDCWKMLDQQ